MARFLPLLGVAGPAAAGGGTNFKTNLWGFWNLDGGATTNANDEHTTANDVDTEVDDVITNTGGGPSSGDVSEFGGNDAFQISSVGADFNGLTEFSCAGWVYNDNSSGDHTYAAVYSWHGNDGRNRIFVFRQQSNELRFHVGQQTATWPDYENKYETTDAANLSATTWHHVAATYNAGTVKLYHNGDLEASTTTNTLPTAFSAGDSGGWFEFGYCGRNSQWPHDGRMSRWSVWTSRVLSDSEVTEHYNSGTPLNYSDY